MGGFKISSFSDELGDKELGDQGEIEESVEE